MNDLRKSLGIDEWLELVKEDKNLKGAYISLAQYMYLLEKEISKHEERQRKLLSSLENELNEERSKDDLWLMGYYDATKDILEEIGELYEEE